MSERSGVEIDYCPQCRGVWLDRGELDKIIDRASGGIGGDPARPAAEPPRPAMTPPPLYNPFEPRSPQPRYDERERHERRDDRRDHDRRGEYDRRRKKKEGWLGDLFDF